MTQGVGSSVDRVHQLVTVLAQQRHLTSLEIAETLWLALQIELETPVNPDPSLDKQEKQKPKNSSTQPNHEGNDPVQTDDLKAVPPSPKVDLSVPTPKMEALPTEALPVWLADPSMLSDSLLVIRALKPLLQKVAAGVGRTLDESATVERVARTQMLVPILQARQEQWFDILLVVDRGSSMHIWSRLVDDVVRILRCYGAFRDVRVFDLDVRSDSQGDDESVDGQTTNARKEMDPIVLRSVPKGTEHRPSELLDQQGRRVVIVLSDCAGKYWWNGTLLPMLYDWGRVMPMVVWQMLPMWMWKRTALGRGTAVAIVNDRPGVANQQLLGQRFDRGDDRDEAQDMGVRLPMPVVTSQVSDLEQWSRMVAGDRRQTVPGFLLPQQGGRVPRSQTIEELAQNRAEDDKDSKTTVEEHIGSIAQERVQRFQQLSSPAAKRLVMLLAAAPVITLPVVRLIRDSMLYAERSPLPVAEVFLGGLLQRLEAQAETDFEWVQYDFLPKVRNTLLAVLPAVDTVDVINRVSAAVERRWNQLRPDQSFRAFLLNPNVKAPPELEGLRSFASVTADILDQMAGEDYKTFANQLRQGLPEPKAVIDSKFPGLPPLEAFSFTPPTLTFEEKEAAIPPAELETVEVATIALESGGRQELEYQSVTLVRASELAVKPPSEETIYFRSDRFSQASRSDVTPYETYADLSRSEREGEDYQIRIRSQSSDTAIVALHGGKMEPGTSELADAVAGDELAFYSFEGLKSRGNRILSIRGTAFDEPRGIELIESVDRVLEFHGDVSQNAVVLIGGRDIEWIERLESALTAAGFEVQRSHRGEKERQPCNRGKTGQGVYIDLPQRLRQELFEGLDGTATPEESRFSQFIKAIRASIPSLHSAWVEQRQRHRRELLTESLAEGVELELMSIPSGEFMMGSPDDEPEHDDDESPQHSVTVSSFYMGRYPITQAQYEAVMGNNPATQYDSDRFVAPDKPVVGVSWEDAQAFCQKLSEQTGKEYRLPSEAEWEYACRAGTTTPFYFGEMITTEVSNYNGSSFNGGPEGRYREQIISVTEFDHANAFGLSDMHGNVREWCLDHWHDHYDAAPSDGSAWIEGGDSSYRVYRGGSWNNVPRHCRSAFRGHLTPDSQSFNLGFRVVLAPRSALPSRQD